jgi:hypothetical protein
MLIRQIFAIEKMIIEKTEIKFEVLAAEEQVDRGFKLLHFPSYIALSLHKFKEVIDLGKFLSEPSINQLILEYEIDFHNECNGSEVDSFELDKSTIYTSDCLSPIEQSKRKILSLFKNDYGEEYEIILPITDSQILEILKTPCCTAKLVGYRKM